MSEMALEEPPAAAPKPNLKPRPLVGGKITYSNAKERRTNMLHELGYRDKQIRLFTHLNRSRLRVQAIVARHLGLDPKRCDPLGPRQWMFGSFNVCTPVHFDGRGRNPRRQLVIRFPLLHRVGEEPCPGDGDEKVSYEVGT